MAIDFDGPADYADRLRKLALASQKLKALEEKELLEGSLIEFYKAAWPNVDAAAYQHNWHLEAIAEHLEAVAFGKIRKLCINLPPRHSKPVAHDALVLTKAKGLVRLDQIIVGDEVLTHKGNWKAVEAVHRQGALPVVRITTEGGREVEAAPDHPFLTPNGWVEAGKLVPDDVVGVVPPTSACGMNTVSREEARLLGYLVGDGTCKGTPNITCADDDETADIIRCASAVGFVATEQRYRITTKAEWLRRISIRSLTMEGEPGRRKKGYMGPVKRWLASHGLLDCSSYTKMAPPCIVNGSDDIVADFIGAYWSCDGFIQLKGRKKDGGERSDLNIGCDSVNKAFMLQMQILLARLGINSRVRKKTVKLRTKIQGDTYTSYNLSLRSQDDCYRFAQRIRLFHSKRSRMEYEYKRRFDFDRPIWGDVVVSVEPAGEKECLCLTVADDKSFTANGIAVHNTLLVSVVFPAWCWAQEVDEQFPNIGPAGKFMCLSYGDQLAMDNAILAKRLIESPWYQERWGSRVMLTKDRAAMNKFDTTAGGTRISGSFRSTVTGRGGNIRIYDDPHKMDEVESEVVREGVLKVYDSTLKSRVTDPRYTAEVLVAQRGHMHDLSAHFLADPGVVHLNLPAEFDSAKPCVTRIGWRDPRKLDGELLWPQRWSPKELAQFKREPFEWAAQWQQSPKVRGGAILREEWWQVYEVPKDGNYDYGKPSMCIASLDTAFTEKTTGDYSALTVWHVFDDPKTKQRRIMLVDGWKKRLELHGVYQRRHPDETEPNYLRRVAPKWGLVEWVAFTCSKRKIDRLIVENAARGHDVVREIKRLYADRTWGVIPIQQKGLDKIARCHSVVDLFTDGMIWAPAKVDEHGNVEFRDFARMVINECAEFPHGVHDDVVDSVTMCLRHLRDINLAIRKEEKIRYDQEEAMYRPPSSPLYPA